MIVAGASAAYREGFEDARTGAEMPAGASPAYMSGYNDYLATLKDTRPRER